MQVETIPVQEPHPTNRRVAFLPKIAIFLGGINLILIQWVLVKEVTTLLLGTELVVLVVSISYFIGVSLGYALARKLSQRLLTPFAVGTLFLHLSMPIWFRLLVSELATSGAYPLAFITLPLLTIFTVPVFYSVLLPLFVDTGEARLSTLYSIELLGSALGVGVLVAFGGVGLQAVFIVYTISLIAIMLSLKVSIFIVVMCAIISVGWLATFPAFNSQTNARFFEVLQGVDKGAVTLFTGYSPYQKVDVIEAPNGARYLFLDGLEHFGSDDGSRLNVILGTVPAQLVDPSNALVIGAGSMQMERMIADIAGHVTTVEIDPMVVDVSVRFFSAYNRMDVLENRSIVIDDAKHFLANTDQYYDLISTDTPAAFTIQTATLYSESFFRIVKSRLYPNGVFALNLTSNFASDDIVSRRIAASALAVFDEVIVVTSGSAGWSFAYASDDFPFNYDDLERAIRANGEDKYEIFNHDATKAMVGDARPVTLDSMDIVLVNSLEWLEEGLQWGN
jgi:spermidine synthase